MWCYGVQKCCSIRFLTLCYILEENFLEYWLRMFVGRRVVSDVRSAFGGGRLILDAALVTNEFVIEISL